MHPSPRLLALGALALALAACGDTTKAPSAQPTPATEAAAATAPVPQPAAEPAPADAPAATAGKPATVADCATTIASNDAMQYDADAIVIPASCAQFTITLEHVGRMPVAAMGHNLVIAREADMRAIATDGIALPPAHLKADDPRVVAHTRMIGGGESASVTFDVAKVMDGGPYRFFCSFPGHLAIMQGRVQVL